MTPCSPPLSARELDVVVEEVQANRYKRLTEDRRPVSRHEVSRDVTRLFRGNFERWTNRDVIASTNDAQT